MPKATVVCYLFSLLFYGLGYLKTLVLKSVDVNSNNFTIYVSLATAYFVITIFFAVIGSLFFYVKKNREQEIIERNKRKRASILKVKAQLSQNKYGMDLERRMSS